MNKDIKGENKNALRRKGNLMKLIVTTIEFLRLITCITVTNNVAKAWAGNPVPTSIEQMLCLT